MVYITTVYGVAAVALVVMALFSGKPMSGFSPRVYLAFLALAVGPQLLGHTSINYGLRYLSAAYVSVALLGEPIGSTILAMLILKEIPTALEVAGGIIILVGIYLASRSQSATVNHRRRLIRSRRLISSRVLRTDHIFRFWAEFNAPCRVLAIPGQPRGCRDN